MSTILMAGSTVAVGVAGLLGGRALLRRRETARRRAEEERRAEREAVEHRRRETAAREAALQDAARDALFAWRSRETVEHLIRILTALHGFEAEDGEVLRRAASRHPEQPLLRHAAGVYELSHGSREAAEAELRAALALDPEPDERAAIELDLERLLGPGIVTPA